MAKELSWKEQKHREELAARKQQDERNRDPEIEQCVVAYVNWVKDFGPRSWEQFRKEWLQSRGNVKAAAEKGEQASVSSERKEG